MKIKPDKYDEYTLTIPKVIEDAYIKDEKEHGPFEDFYDWWCESGEELFDPEDRNIFIDKEIAEFIIDMINGFKLVYSDSGDDREYEGNTSDWFEFEENGYKYSICAYGTIYNLNNLIGYKEKLQKKGLNNESSN